MLYLVLLHEIQKSSMRNVMLVSQETALFKKNKIFPFKKDCETQ